MTSSSQVQTCSWRLKLWGSWHLLKEEVSNQITSIFSRADNKAELRVNPQDIEEDNFDLQKHIGTPILKRLEDYKDILSTRASELTHSLRKKIQVMLSLYDPAKVDKMFDIMEELYRKALKAHVGNRLTLLHVLSGIQMRMQLRKYISKS